MEYIINPRYSCLGLATSSTGITLVASEITPGVEYCDQHSMIEELVGESSFNEFDFDYEDWDDESDLDT
jgi:hypothetical protein